MSMNDYGASHGLPHASAQSLGQRSSKLALALLVLGWVAMLALAVVTWGGLFTPLHLGLVIAGSVLFLGAGVLTVVRSRGTFGAIIGFVCGHMLLAAPLVVVSAVTAGSHVFHASVVAAIALWISGVAPVALAVSVFAVIAIHRARVR